MSKGWIERTADKIKAGDTIRTQFGPVIVDRVETAPTPGYIRIHGRDRMNVWVTIDRARRNPFRLVTGA